MTVRSTERNDYSGWNGIQPSLAADAAMILFDPQFCKSRQSLPGEGSTIWQRLHGGGSVNIVSELTVPEKILQAAYYLEEHGQSPFSAEALIVTSWQKYPKTFGLKGYDEQYPDSNKILSSIMGERGLARRGWLAKMGQKLYTLTFEGRQVVVRLHAGGETSERLSQVKLTREHEKHLLNLLGSNAAQKFEEGLKEELTFADACGFWGITDS